MAVFAETVQAQNGAGTPADGSQPSATPMPGGATPAEGDAQAQYAAYWAAYGYDVNDPQCECPFASEDLADVGAAVQAWQASQYGQQGAQTPAT